MLSVIKGIAEKHQLTMQTVALRWQMDQGTFPLLEMKWAPKPWQQFGYGAWGKDVPGIDARLLHKASFLDEHDMKALNGIIFH